MKYKGMEIQYGIQILSPDGMRWVWFGSVYNTYETKKDAIDDVEKYICVDKRYGKKIKYRIVSRKISQWRVVK